MFLCNIHEHTSSCVHDKIWLDCMHDEVWLNSLHGSLMHGLITEMMKNGLIAFMIISMVRSKIFTPGIT